MAAARIVLVLAMCWNLPGCGIFGPGESEQFPVGTFELYQIEVLGDTLFSKIRERQSLPAIVSVTPEGWIGYPDTTWVTSGSLTITSDHKWIRRTSVVEVDSAGQSHQRETVDEGYLELKGPYEIRYRYGPDGCWTCSHLGGWDTKEVWLNTSSWVVFSNSFHNYYRIN